MDIKKETSQSLFQTNIYLSAASNLFWVRIIGWNVSGSQVSLVQTGKVYQYNIETQTDVVISGTFGVLMHFKTTMNKIPACFQND